MKRITREEWDALSDAEKGQYAPMGDGYVAVSELTAAYSTLKESLDAKDAKLKEKDEAISKLQEQHQGLSEKLEELGDLDEVREALAKAKELKGKELIDKGDYEKALDLERQAHQKALDKLNTKLQEKEAEIERQLVNGAFAAELGGRMLDDGTEIPGVLKEHKEAVDALLRTKFAPKVIQNPDGTHQAVAKVNGLEQPLPDAIRGWLQSDAAKHYVPAAETSGGHNPGVKPGQSGGGPKKTVSEKDAGSYLEDIAKGSAVIAASP